MVEGGTRPGSGIPGSRVSERSSCGVPSRPAAASSWAARKPVSKRRLKPTWRGTPAALVAAMARSASARVRAMGFSQNTALPAPAAASTSSAWKRAGAAITTASSAGSASSSAGSVVARPAPSELASLAAAPGAGSATPASRAPGSRRARVSPWKAPIQPAPMSPTATGSPRASAAVIAQLLSVGEPGPGEGGAEPGQGLLAVPRRPRLEADGAAVAQLLQRGGDGRVVDLPGPGLTAPGNVGHLDLADQGTGPAQQLDQVPLPDLGVVQVQHHPQARRPTASTRARVSA